DPDIVELGKRGNTMAVSLVETLNGGAGGDWITIAGTIHLSGIETVIGGAGMDAVGLGDGGNALIMAAVETLIGGAGIDRVSLGARGGTVLVRGVETLTGGTGADVVAFRDGAPVWFQGGAGADTVYAPATDGLWLNWSDAADGADSVVDFSEARGVLGFGGALAATADKNGDGFVSLTRRATGAADGRTDEVVRLEQRVAQLSGDGFASFRQALGQLAPGRAAPMLALADDGASTGLYFVGEQISLLARFEGVLLQRPHLALAG
ncbi:MAG: hypothetical protein HQL39_12050, partial [Alphaproteobacteria bacterium]|nr:hypothetical protein [Alphaproteobacteria bacterium]